MSSIYSDIHTFLLTLTDLITLLDGDRIQWPDGDITVKNGIIYRLISDPKLNETNLRVAADRKWQLWRFFINNENPLTCQQIADELESQFHQYSGTLGNSVAHMVFMESNSSPLLLDDLSTYQVIQDYRITILPTGD